MQILSGERFGAHEAHRRLQGEECSFAPRSDAERRERGLPEPQYPQRVEGQGSQGSQDTAAALWKDVGSLQDHVRSDVPDALSHSRAGYARAGNTSTNLTIKI